MNRIIASLLIIFIFSMHSAWAIGVHVDSGHSVDLSSHAEGEHSHAIDGNTAEIDKACNEHDCHIASHTAGLLSFFTLTVNNIEQDIDATVTFSTYLHSPKTPQRPPKA